MYFELAGDVSGIEVIAEGSRIRRLPQLEELYGHGRWRKLKGVGVVRLADGTISRAELHWLRGPRHRSQTSQDQEILGLDVNPAPHLLICVANEGAEDLQVLKVYRHLSDESAESRGFFRVIDDSGEDYLYPRSSFLPLPLPPALEQQLEDLAVDQSHV